MIISRFTSLVMKSGGTVCREPVNTRLMFDLADPLAVTIEFREPGAETVVWNVSLEALAEGAYSTEVVGTGDARFRLAKDDRRILMLCLRSPEGHADIGLPASSVYAFLAEVKEATPDEDCISAALDEALKEILGS